MPIGRLDLFMVLRNQLADRALVRRALAVEAVMEELAGGTGADPTVWGMAGFGADIDARLAEKNPERRGAIAEELLLAEGVPPEAAAAARGWRPGHRAAELAPIARGLAAAQLLVDLIVAELAEPEVTLDGLQPVVLDHRLRRRARRGDPEAARVDECLALLGLSRPRAAELALRGCLRVREDLAW